MLHRFVGYIDWRNKDVDSILDFQQHNITNNEITTSTTISPACVSSGGCHCNLMSGNKCWRECVVDEETPGWCFSTQSYEFSYNYVSCFADTDCSLCDPCTTGDPDAS